MRTQTDTHTHARARARERALHTTHCNTDTNGLAEHVTQEPESTGKEGGGGG